MAGLVPAIHVFRALQSREDVDARDERGHDHKQPYATAFADLRLSNSEER